MSSALILAGTGRSRCVLTVPFPLRSACRYSERPILCAAPVCGEGNFSAFAGRGRTRRGRCAAWPPPVPPSATPPASRRKTGSPQIGLHLLTGAMPEPHPSCISHLRYPGGFGVSRKLLPLLALFVTLAGLLIAVVTPSASSAAGNEDCRPDGLYRTPGMDVPYCTVYNTAGREKMGTGHARRVIGYFTGWRTGKDGTPAYLVNNIPWTKVTHLNYAFAHIGADNKISVGDPGPNNAAIGMEWPGVAGAEMDPTLSYKGHFNLLTKYKKLNPNVKTLISIGGWAETGGILNADGTRNATGGFYRLAQSQSTIDTFADSVVQFLRTYGFNGADIDYEYATSNNYAGNPDDFWISN